MSESLDGSFIFEGFSVGMNEKKKMGMKINRNQCLCPNVTAFQVSAIVCVIFASALAICIVFYYVVLRVFTLH